MYENLMQFLDIINSRVNESEDDLILHVIMPIVVNHLGYKLDNCKNQKRSSTTGKITDILFQDKKDNKLVIEVKKATETLSDKHLYQLSGYLNSLEIEWGILTNGYEWILISNKIMGTERIGLSARIVSRIDLRQRKKKDPLNPTNINVFSYDAIFKSKITFHNKLSQQYKIYLINLGRKKSTYTAYIGTLNRFADFITYKHKKFISYGVIDSEDIFEFVRWYASTNKNRGDLESVISLDTVENIYRNLNTCFNTLVDKGDIIDNPIKKISIDELINQSKDLISIQEDVDFSNIEEVIKQVYVSYESNRDFESSRNKAIFSLMLYGLDRNLISKVKLINFNFDDLSILVNDDGIIKKLKLSDKMAKQIQDSIDIRFLKGIKSQWLFCSSTGKNITPEIISREIVNKHLKKFSNLTIEVIRQRTLRTLLHETRDVISLLYITGLDIKRFGDMLSWEDIKKLSDTKKIMSKHPFKDYIG